MISTLALLPISPHILLELMAFRMLQLLAKYSLHLAFNYNLSLFLLRKLKFAFWLNSLRMDKNNE